ncbi:MAG TPA: cytochrome c [Hyphomonadaceae bacterium]|jgi:cytochrome c556|nr:cytochrome c [Hyphomonadaceae bacterium]HPI48283.1 cytochrome c [Hyphomonadaceae bacterium]
MKIKLFAATAVLALGLAACGGETPAPETPAPEAPAAEAPAPEPVPATASIGETPADPVAFMKTRHDNYEDLGKNFKVLLDNSKLGTPDMAAVAAAAAKVNEYAGQMGTWFPPGTGPEAGKTEAKANIWTDRADFDAKLANLQTEAGKLVTAAGTDAAAFKAQFGPTGGTCKACHDTYREEDKDK